MQRFRSPAQEPAPTEIRETQAREKLVQALRECGELADAVEHFQGSELMEVLNYLNSLRLIMAENEIILWGVVAGEEHGN